jgi:asparagine synthase (glutamine-hydrolysing)
MAVSFADSFYKRNLEPQDFFFSHRPRWNTTSSLQFLLNKDFIQLTDSIDPLDTLRDLLPDDADAWDDLNKAQWIEIATLLSGYLLSAQGDRMLMAHGVEGRFPFLDTEVMDFANTLPHFMKLRGLNEKYILKQAFGRDLPEEIVDRPKQPYRAPDAASFFFDTKCDWINTLTSETEIRKAGLFNPGMINRLIAKCSGCKGMGMSNTDNMRIVGILSLMLIHHLFIQYNGFGSHQRETRYIKVIDLISGG